MVEVKAVCRGVNSMVYMYSISTTVPDKNGLHPCAAVGDRYHVFLHSDG